MAKIISIVDDIDHANGIETRADGTYRLSWDGLSVDLDLTKAHAREIENLIAHLFRIGTIAGKQAAGSKSPNRRGYLKGLRSWADAAGRRSEYRTPSGSYCYRKQLRADYDAHLAALQERQ